MKDVKKQMHRDVHLGACLLIDVLADVVFG